MCVIGDSIYSELSIVIEITEIKWRKQLYSEYSDNRIISYFNSHKAVAAL